MTGGETSEPQSPAEPARRAIPGEDHCIFECSDLVFAAAIRAVREVLSGKLATPVPQTPPALVGVIELHGDMLPLVLLATLLGIPGRPYTPANPILVLGSPQANIGVVVDRVRHVRPLDSASLGDATQNLYRAWTVGTTPRIAVLDVDALVTHALRTVIAHIRNAAIWPPGGHGSLANC